MRGLLRIACLIAWLLLLPCSVALAAPGPCRLIDPSTCPNANELARSNGFVQALGHFTTDSKASYFKSNRSLTEQAMSGLGGSGDSMVALPDRRFLFVGCPSRDCRGNATAIILNEYGQIEALGFSSFHCQDVCDDTRHLDFYFRKDSQDDALLATLKAWGTSDKLRRSLLHPEADDGIDSRMDVHVIP
ncbi:hypothetical protein [Dyella sp. ASV21]|uniref:hypothetical protein n=1 Tax=Dyella sp. ASV21 TaxID=2795114 RepID=UPI0018ED94AA|nr:hypothetical protein [Dyella sp. ASV21]